MKGMVSLYEASYLSIKNEKIMDEAQDFAMKHMKDYTNDINSKDENLFKLVSHALEFPQHWREPRQEARLRFYWSVGYNSDPEFSYGRRVLTAITAFITTIDDIYDVYATLAELELLTKLTKRWDAADLEQLPDYIKVCFTVFHNDMNEVAKVAEREHGIPIHPYFQKVWTDLFEAYLLETRYHSGYKPSLSEYLDNAWISVTASFSTKFSNRKPKVDTIRMTSTSAGRETLSLAKSSTWSE
ncbi:hypothetical protein POM88_032725 [Heracleum sosnowskyi]|uniref:Uncharacterized protein n=1 Tax=Heracleum sosnowskyi TaxID=360622 RepID=A0AAD8MKW5_9APIA|nr:hypothetical protein POM88_032725 [Heracleum sosnowskyi]